MHIVSKTDYENVLRNYFLHGDRKLTKGLGDFENLAANARLDMVVDDAFGQRNVDVLESFRKIWPRVQVGGLYFILGLENSRTRDSG